MPTRSLTSGFAHGCSRLAWLCGVLRHAWRAQVMGGWGLRREGGLFVWVGLGEEWDACLNWDVFSELAVCIKSLRCYADGKKHQSVRSSTQSSLNLYQDDDDVKPSPCRGDPSVLQQAGCSHYIPQSRYSPPNQVLNLVDVAGQNLEG